MRKLLGERHEVVQLATLLAVALNAGLGVVASLEAVMPRASGPIAKRFTRLLAALELGGNLQDELGQMRVDQKSPALDELALKLQVSLQFGTPLAEQLILLVGTNRSFIASAQLAESAKRENLMLLPLVFLILPITVVFAVFPSLQYLSLNP
jgi:tight adherence protein C